MCDFIPYTYLSVYSCSTTYSLHTPPSRKECGQLTAIANRREKVVFPGQKEPVPVYNYNVTGVCTMHHWWNWIWVEPRTRLLFRCDKDNLWFASYWYSTSSCTTTLKLHIYILLGDWLSWAINVSNREREGYAWWRLSSQVVFLKNRHYRR